MTVTPHHPFACSIRGTRHWPLWALALLFVPPVGSAQPGDTPTYADLAPVLNQHCTLCHQGDAAPIGLRLDSLDGLLEGSTRGPVVNMDDPAGSELVRRLKGESQPRMPLTGPPYLTDEQIAVFERWIAAGMPEGTATQAVTDSPASEQSAPEQPAPGEPITYRHVAPIFATRCVKCHRDDGLMGSAPEGFRLTSYDATLSSADRVRVVPGNPAASELVRRVLGQARPRMPFDGPPYLPDDDVQLIIDWIAQGARDSEGNAAPVPVGGRVRLHGTLGAGWRLDDLPLAVGADTRIDKAPRPGDYVQVRGHLDAQGGVNARRIRRR